MITAKYKNGCAHASIKGNAADILCEYMAITKAIREGLAEEEEVEGGMAAALRLGLGLSSVEEEAKRCKMSKCETWEGGEE